MQGMLEILFRSRRAWRQRYVSRCNTASSRKAAVNHLHGGVPFDAGEPPRADYFELAERSFIGPWFWHDSSNGQHILKHRDKVAAAAHKDKQMPDRMAERQCSPSVEQEPRAVDHAARQKPADTRRRKMLQ